VTKVKICGLKTAYEVEVVNKFSPDYVGFIFAPSKRRITLEQAKQLKWRVKPTIQTVGVFVNEPIKNVLACENAGVIDMIQIHGDEDLVYINSLRNASKLPIMKAFRIKDESTLEENKVLLESQLLNYVLLDTYHKDAYGGIGESFDWKLLSKVKRPYFLAGGIGSDNVSEAMSHHPYAIDISSKVETEGMKDEKKLTELFRSIEKYRS